VTRLGRFRALTALLIALLIPLGTAERAAALDPNQAPDVVLPADGDTDEDAPYNFTADTAVITVTDADAGTDDVQLNLSVTSGVLHVADPSGLTFVNGTANDSDVLDMTGSLAAFDAALDKLQFMPAPDDTETVTLTAVGDDLGHNGDGGSQTDSDSMDITVNPVNDAPVVTVPGTQSIDEDGTATLSSGTFNPVTISDVDAGTAPVQVTLHATAGTTTLASTTGLSFTDGDGTADGTTTFTATLDDANAALDGLTFTPDANFGGSAGLTVTADDQGNTGAGGALTAQQTVDLTVDPVNDAPVNTVPVGVSTTTDVPLVLSAADLDAVSVGDVDSGSSDIEVALTATHGTLTLGQSAGVTIVDGAEGTGSVTFDAPMVDANDALDGLTFTPAAGFSGQADITITTDDLGNTGSGGALTDTDTFPVTVSSVAVVTPKLSFGATRVAVSATGQVLVPVSCAGAACSGTLSFRSGGTVLGSATFSLAAGGSGPVPVVLTPAGRTLVSSRPAADVTTVVAMTNAATRASVLTLVAARAPAVTLSTGKARLRGGKIAVTLGCPPGAPTACRATLVLTATIAGHATTLATKTVTIAAGGHKTLKLRMSASVRKALRAGPLTATQTVTSDVLVGLDTTGSRPIKLRG
jgi:hypothetical protein